jgi:cytidine deaminase
MLGTDAPLEVQARVQAQIQGIAWQPGGAGTIPASAAARLVAELGLPSSEELALLALPVADAMARPVISGYRVAAVGIEAESGDLVLGANLEFPGGELTTTIHAEGFVAVRARNRGQTLATLVVREAHPCAHCRQMLSESAAADGLVLVDLEGNRLTLADLYPWPFRPAALGVPGDAAGSAAWAALTFLSPAPPPEIPALLLAAGAHAHAPYSKAPSAVAVRLTAGQVHAAGCMESVAFNPSISALQAALVEVVAAGEEPADIGEAWLALTDGGAVDPEPGFRALLGAVAPDAIAHVVRWRHA